MTKLKIFFDMDGVLVDFVGGVEDLLGKVSDETKANRELHEWYNMEASKFWSLIRHEDFWYDLRELPYGFKLKAECEAIGAETYFCSSPSLSPECLSGKLSWIQCYYGGQNARRFFFTPHKHLLAGPDRLLIDDYAKNINKFTDAGGHGILFPQPWNGCAEGGDMNLFIEKSLELIKQLEKSLT